MKYIIQNLFILFAFAGIAQSDLPIYKNVKFVKEYDMSLNDSKVFISSPFAKKDLKVPSQLNFKDKKITKVTYLYSYNNENPTFAQNKLSDDRYQELMDHLEGADMSNVEWETDAQAGCGDRPCSKELYHGFVVEFEKFSPLGHNQLKDQKFKIQSDKGNTVKGAHGTKVSIPTSAFVDAFGNQVEGEVDIHLKEAITTEQIVLGGLHTLTESGEVLQSKGMIKVEAWQNGNQLYLQPGKVLSVEVPTDYEEGYSYYEGGQQNGDLVWGNPEPIVMDPAQMVEMDVDLDENNNGNANNDVVNNNQGAGKIGFAMIGADQMMNFFPFKVNYTDNDLKSIMLFKNGKKIFVDEEKVDVDQLMKKGLDQVEAEKVKGWFDADTVNTEDLGWVVNRQSNFILGAEFAENNQGQVIGQNNTAFTENKLSNAFKMNKMGWANIDCLSSMKNTKRVALNVIQDEVEDLDEFNISLVIPGKNIFIQGYQKKNGSYAFTHGDYENEVPMPVGKKAYIVAMGEKDDQIFFEMKEIKIGDLPIEHLAMQPVDKNHALTAIRETL